MKTTINLCLNNLISCHYPSLLEINPNIVYYKCYWLLNRGKNNRRTLIGTAERWPWLLNRGGHLKGVSFSIKLRIVSGLY